MNKIKIFIVLIGACMLLFFCVNKASNGSNSGISTSEQATSTEAEIKIGTQTWSTKNLDVSTFRNGDTIPQVKTNEDWVKAGKEGKPASCYYDNDPENGRIYGKLYNWYALNDPRGLAPKGWHVPTDAEWTTLTDYLGGDSIAGTKMKSSSGWNEYFSENGNGSDKSKFTGFPGGSRDQSVGIFFGIGSFGLWWSSSERRTDVSWMYTLGSNSPCILRTGFGKRAGMSVRVLRD